MDNFFRIITLSRIVQSIGILFILLTSAFFIIHYFPPALASKSVLDKMPEINDPNLELELVFREDIESSSMAFLGSDDILLLDKNDGTVHRIINGTLLEKPLLDVNVANKRERGMLGIATTVSSNGGGTKYVFLYYTESFNEDGNDICTADYCEPGNDPLGNRLYRYELKDNKLVYPKLLLDLQRHLDQLIMAAPYKSDQITIYMFLVEMSMASQVKSRLLRLRTLKMAQILTEEVVYW